MLGSVSFFSRFASVRQCSLLLAAAPERGTRRVVSSSLMLLASSAVLSVTLSGCGMGKNLADGAPATPVAAMTGHVHGGQQPVAGATVTFYAASTNGYGSAATILDTTTTDGNGNFTLTGNYTCPASPNDQVYLVAAGGNPGGGVNASLALMAGLGACANLTPSTFININEVTTIASAYALAPFVTASPNVGTSSTNYLGLVNAFNTIGNLVNTGTGTALTITPAYAANPVPGLNTSTVPQSRINTLADILASCVNSTAAGGIQTACATLFTAATPPNGTAPIDTLQAALNIAQNPGNNVATLYGLSSGTSPFQPSLGVAPTDWQIAITYTGAGLGVPGAGDISTSALAIDAQGNPWVTAYGFSGNGIVSNSGMIAEFSNLGAPLTPQTTVSNANPPVTTYGGYQLESVFANSSVQADTMAFDQLGNAWVSTQGGSLDAITSGLMPLLPAPVATGSTGPVLSIAVDEIGNIWTSGNPGIGVISEYSNSGTLLLSSGGGGTYPASYYGTPSPILFDSTGNNLWASDSAFGDLYLITGGSTDQLNHDYYASGGTYTALAAGANGNIYGCPTGASSIMVFTASSTAGPTSTYPTSTGRGCGNSMVIDGAGNLWVLASPVVDEYSSTGTQLSPAAGYTATSSGESPTFPSPNALAIDGSGNLWILNTSSTIAASTINTLAEVVGAAAPVVTPIALALANGQLGTLP